MPRCNFQVSIPKRQLVSTDKFKGCICQTMPRCNFQMSIPKKDYLYSLINSKVVYTKPCPDVISRCQFQKRLLVSTDKFKSCIYQTMPRCNFQMYFPFSNISVLIIILFFNCHLKITSGHVMAFYAIYTSINNYNFLHLK